MKNLIIFLFVVAATAVNQAQEVTHLEEVNLSFVPSDTEVIKTPEGFTFNIDNVGSHEFASDPIGFMYANFDIKNYIATLKNDNFDSYVVSFRTRSGSMIAKFDEVGNLISTRQNFKNVLLPRHMIQSVYKNYKGWTMTKTKYRASTKGEVLTKAVYRITLQNGERKQNVKIKGNNTGVSVASN